MAELVANCPRCGAEKITFDVSAANIIGEQHGRQLWYEAFCACRNCHVSTIYVLSDSTRADYEHVHRVGLLGMPKALNNYVEIERFVSLRDMATVRCPEHVPGPISAVFAEGATCLSTGCYNAAGTMFRLCVDLTTRAMLPNEPVEGLSEKQRRDLGLRVKWLLDNGYLPKELKELSAAIREDGNDGAHAGTLKKPEAEDVLDFTVALLERIHTEPKRLELAKERREARRATPEKK